MKTLRIRILAAGLASAVGAATPVLAAPVMSSTAALKSIVPTATDVRWRGGGGAAIAGGVIAGLAAGAIAGAASAPYGYGGDPYYGPGPGPAYYDYAPAAGGPAYYPQTYYYGGHDPAGCGPGGHVC